MKKLKYISMILTAGLLIMSCEKHEITFDARPVDNMALVQFHNQLPIPAGSANNFYKVELNGVDVTHGSRVTLNSWGSIPAELGRNYVTNPGLASIKLYQSANMVLKYEQTVTLQTGKQGLILYDLNQPPLVFTEPDNFISDRASYDTDTIEYVRFFNLMYERPGTQSNLKLQYQYQYVINPIYTLADAAAGIIPEGSKVGDPVPSPKTSAWINMGEPVGFGENTGWQLVPLKKASSGSSNSGTARVDYRIKVAEGGTVGTNMTADNLLICNDRATGDPVNGCPDYWVGTVGRRYYHFVGGHRAGGPPGVAVVQLTLK